MDMDNSLLTRLAVNGPTLGDAPMLLMAVVLVLALSGVVSSVSQQLQKGESDAASGADPKRRRLTRKLSNIGLSTLVTEVPTNLSIPVSVLTVQGHLTKEDYVERLRARLLHDAFFLRWRSIVCGDYQTGVYKYVELADYDVAQNVVEHTVEEGETTMSYVESALVNSPLDFDKPLWEMHVIHDPKGNPGVTSVGWKVHHCLGDGASLATAMAKLSDQSELFDAMLEKRAQAKKNPKAKKPRKPLAQTFKDLLVFLYVWLWSLYVISYHMFALVLRREPATVFKRPGGKHKRLSYNMIYSVKTTKAVGKHFRATVNDVMLNVVAGAMRKTMLAMGESVAPTLKVRCAIPVDMRSTTEVIRHTSNRFSSLVIDLPVGIEDSAERLHKVTVAMGEAKNSLEKYFVYWSSHLISMLPAPIMRFIVHFTTSRISVASTNVRASVVEMSMCKSQVSGFYGFVPPPPYVNLGIAILSMGDDLGLNVLVDPSVGVNAKQFLEFAKEEFTTLQESVTAMETDAAENKKTNFAASKGSVAEPSIVTVKSARRSQRSESRQVMEVAQVPTQPVDVAEPVVSKPSEHKENNNQMESNNPAERVKTPEPELVPQAPIEESRPADASVTRSNSDEVNMHAVVSESPLSPHTSRSSEGGSEVVTPAGTVEAPIRATVTPRAEAVEKEGVAFAKKESEAEPAAPVMENEPEKVELKVDQKVERSAEHDIEHKFEPKAEQSDEPMVEHKVEQQEEATISLVAAEAQAVPSIAPVSKATIKELSLETDVQVAASSPGKTTKNDKKQANSDSFASDDKLNDVQKFLVLQIVENRCSSHTKEIHEFMEQHLNEKQRKRYVVSLVERIVQHFTKEATAKGEEVSVDVQSNICLIEQMFLTLGRRSPLEDMYTAEEEEMLDLLFHSNSSDNLPIDI